ncbi:MAG TPA: DMT family transporter [Thermoanaerobaculaceae bacterium]|nr:DMT family transporter [Thermoanaerobaculaceae bacterium]
MTRRGIAHALGAIALWSTLAVLGVRLRAVPPLLLVGIALLLGALAGGRALLRRPPRPAVLALGVYGLFAYHLCVFLGLRLAPPVEANLVNYLWPLLIVVLTPLFIRGATLRPRHLVAALLGFGGAVLLISGGSLRLTAARPVGYLFSLAAALIWSTYSLLTKRIGDFPTSAVAWFCLVSGALALGCHFAFEPAYAPSAGDLACLVPLGLGPMGAAFYLWDAALKRGDPRVIGALAYLAPLLSTLWLVVGGGARLSAISVAAMALIVGGAAIGTTARPRERES